MFKSREVGASWMAMFRAAHDFLFNDGATIGLVSAKKELVDSLDNSALMPKIDFILSEKRMPWWMLPRKRVTGGGTYVRNECVFHNPENDASIVGYACTDDVGRGGRKLYFFADEIDFWPQNQIVPAMSAMLGNTHCRVVCSTPNLPGGVYHDWVVHHESRDIELIDLYWQEDPDKRSGLYTSENGRLKIIDREFWASVLDCPVGDLERRIRANGCNFKFELDGKVRSPYMDWSLRRAESPREAHREFERVFEGKGGSFFTHAVFERHKAEYCIAPLRRGQFQFDVDTGEVSRWHEDPLTGPVLVWMEWLANHDRPAVGVSPPRNRRYVLAADIAAGTGGSHSSNSVAVVVDAETGEQVLEFATGNMRPERFAKWCAGVAAFFNDALLIWDAHGNTGSSFTKALRDETGYGNLYVQRVRDTVSERDGSKIGFRATTNESKVAMLDALEAAVDGGRYMIRSDASFAEIPQYVWLNGQVQHSTSVRTDDASAMKNAHGDRVIAHAIAVEGIKSLGGLPKKGAKAEETYSSPVPGTLSWRLHERELEQQAAENIFDF